MATQGTQDTRRRKTKQKHKSIYIGHHYPQTNTNNVNKTRALLQTTGDKDKPHIGCMTRYKSLVEHAYSSRVHESTNPNPFCGFVLLNHCFCVCVCVCGYFFLIIFFWPMHITFVCCYFWLTVRCFQTFLAFYTYDSYMYVVRAIICFDIVSSRVKNKSWNMDSSHFANKIIPLYCKV